jgi:hypothetical protein
MLDIFTVSFFGHRRIEDFRQVEKQLDELVRRLIREKEYVDFLIGRNGEFDQLVSSTVRRAKRDIDNSNSSLILVLPYMTAEYGNNKESFEEYYDEIEICASKHPKSAFRLRNRAMVDRSDLVVFCVDRSEGGAYQTARYTKRSDKEYINLGSLDL